MTDKVPSPAISISLSVEPTSFTVNEGNPDLPILSITATSHATQPITIHTARTLLDLPSSQNRGSFTCTDMATGRAKHIRTSLGPCQRYGYDRTRCRENEKYFVTLEPDTPVTFSYPFAMARWGLALPEGRCYSFAVWEGEALRTWWYGRRKDVMASPSIPLEWPLKMFSRRRSLLSASGEPIEVSAAPVEFEILAQKVVSG